jgi:exosome complex RNA-binding protein Rrp42 (RNase PH superfamily)
MVEEEEEAQQLFVDVVVVAATTTTEDVAIAAIHATLQIHVLTTKVRSMQTPSQHSG